MSPALCANYLFMSLKIHTPHSHTHTHTAHTHPARHTSHLCREPSNALHTLRRPSGKFLKHMCSLPPSFQAVPTSFCLTSLSLFLSPSLPHLSGSWWLELPARLSLLGALVLAFQFAVRCFRLSSHFGLPAIDLHSVNMPTPSSPLCSCSSFQGQTQSVPNWPCNAVLFLQHFPLDSATVACLSFAAVTWAFCRIPDEAGECRGHKQALKVCLNTMLLRMCLSKGL